MSEFWKQTLKDLGLAVVIIGSTFVIGESVVWLVHNDPFAPPIKLVNPATKPDLGVLEDLLDEKPKAILDDTCDVNNVCHVYFSDTISSPGDYTQLAKQLETATAETVIHIHLAGYGGQADTIYYLSNLINKSKAQVITDVEGNVMSAHAAIAMSGKVINVSPDTYFLFHYPAVVNPVTKEYVPLKDICGLLKGKDRGILNSENCYAEDSIENKLANRFFTTKVAPYLTKEEIKAYYEGRQVLILGNDMAFRLARGHA